MPSPSTPADLLDLKMLPAWASETGRANEYADFEGEDSEPPPRRGDRRDRDAQRRAKRPPDRRSRDGRERRGPAPRGAQRGERREQRGSDRIQLPKVDVRFLPHAPAFESVVAQIKSGVVAYSVFALARLFLEKPERYDVRLSASENQTLHRLGENGPVATDLRILENNAFTAA